MIPYLLRRILTFIPTLIGITLITFFLMKAIPGDPVFGIVGERADPETIERIRKEIGGEKGVISQYLGYMTLLIQGELGRSYYTNQKVGEEIFERFPNTMKLALAAMLFALLIGIPSGIIGATRKGEFIDRLLSMLAAGSISIPVFWLGLILMLIFGLYLHWLPPSGTGGLIYIFLPALTLGIHSSGTIARITRSSFLEVLGEQYITTARAKGIREGTIIFRHALKNALIPIITILGLDFGSYLNGAVLTETIFGWDGFGRYAMEGIIKRDYPVIMGTVLTGSIAFVFINFIVDVAYFYIDPRIKKQ